VTVIEAERSADQNFSETPTYLGWQRKFPPCVAPLRFLPTRGLSSPFTTSPFVQRTSRKYGWRPQFPPSDATISEVVVNGQIFPIAASRSSLYGDSFGWYKLGVNPMAGGMIKVRVQVKVPGSSVIAGPTPSSSPPSVRPRRD